MSKVGTLAPIMAALLLLLAGPLSSAQAATAVTVFDFQMKSATPEWSWLQKALADRTITDLFQEESLAVVQRDDMERLARQMAWTPEMATDPRHLETIGRSFQATYLVSGLYDLSGDRLSITAIIVDLQKRREVARCQVAGPDGEVLHLLRQLSSQVLAWLTKRPAKQVLAELPAWTRSLPAARALYEGLDLYDQGRYGEAWLRFRQAAQHDPDYAESQYWVGKMYYFMNRYEHARLALAGFLHYRQKHPRTGDAMVELVDTSERTGTTGDELLRLYERLEQEFAEALVPVRHGRATGRCWLLRKRARLLAHLGRYEEAVPLVGAWFPHSAAAFFSDNRELAEQYMMASHQLSGRCYSAREIDQHLGLPASYPQLCRFEAAGQSFKVSPGGGHRAPGQPLFTGRSGDLTLIAAEGRLFKSLTIKPVATSARGKLTAWVGLGGPAPLMAVKEMPLEMACREGLRVDDPPQSGWLRLRVTYEVERPLDELVIAAELEEAGPGGAINVQCQTTAEFDLRVDGRLTRRGPGLVGPLAPGEHRLTFEPLAGQGFGPWQTTATVAAGRAVQVTGRLEWPTTGPLAGGRPATLVTGEPPLPGTFWNESSDTPSILLDDQTVRLVWSRGGDLWSSRSTDGHSFTAPRQLELPVSSGWLEEAPLAARDESGRFVVLFQGDRDARHEVRTYACWSRSFEHWSAPFLADRPRGEGRADQPPGGLVAGAPANLGQPPGGLLIDGLLIDPRARFYHLRQEGRPYAQLVASPGAGDVTIEMPNRNSGRQQETVIQRRDGRYELLRLTRRPYLNSQRAPLGEVCTLWRALGPDGVNWSPAAPLAEFVGTGRSTHLAAMQAEGRTVIGLFRDKPDSLMILRQGADDKWQRSLWIDGLGGPLSDLAWHPRWGLVLAWLSLTPDRTRIGPYVTSWADLEPLLQNRPAPAAAREASEFLALARALELSDQVEPARAYYASIITQWPESPAAAEARQRLKGRQPR